MSLKKVKVFSWKLPLWFWLSCKLLFTKKNLFKPSTLIAIIGLAIGVGTLIVSMAVISGYTNTLKKAVSDSTGHVQILRTSAYGEDWRTLLEKIKQIEPTLTGATRFVYSEGVVAQRGQVFGVVLQGLDTDSYASVLNIKTRLVEGSDHFQGQTENRPHALIGKGIAKRLSLHIGDTLNVVIPLMQSSLQASDINQFRRKLISFKVVGVLDLGKFEWNEKFIVSELTNIQTAAELNQSYTGLFLKFTDINHARSAGFHIAETLGRGYWVKDWRDLNENVFDAAEFEKIIIFLVVLIIVVVAAFNLTSTIFINVMQSYTTLSVLKSLGLRRQDILKLFSAQGLILGGLSLLLGLVFGLLFCLGFLFLQDRLGVIAGSVYKIDHIDVSLQWIDLLFVALATLLICFLASLAPAYRGSRLSVTEGLKYG